MKSAALITGWITNEVLREEEEEEEEGDGIRHKKYGFFNLLFRGCNIVDKLFYALPANFHHST